MEIDGRLDVFRAARLAAEGFARRAGAFHLVDEFESEAMVALPPLLAAHDFAKCDTAAWMVGPIRRHLAREWSRRRRPTRYAPGSHPRRLPSDDNLDLSSYIDKSWRLGFDLVDDGRTPPPLLGHGDDVAEANPAAPRPTRVSGCCSKHAHSCNFCPECGRELRNNVFMLMLAHCRREATRAKGMAKSGRKRSGWKNYDPAALAAKWDAFGDACERALAAGLK